MRIIYIILMKAKCIEFIIMVHTGNRTLQLTLLYNTLYNVSLTGIINNVYTMS